MSEKFCYVVVFSLGVGGGISWWYVVVGNCE